MLFIAAALPLLANVAKGEIYTAEREPEPELETSDLGSGNNDDDSGGITTTLAIALLVVGPFAVLSVLLYACWPSLKTLWTSPPTPMITKIPMQKMARASQNRTLPSLTVPDTP